ncbi:hypothetical protein B0H14DRAFT_3148838 [Mycena olivaceomarginata]|nr:hypothetical protein B0H14DRAFT_3148838 [Mycena olivaceomarginata]
MPLVCQQCGHQSDWDGTTTLQSVKALPTSGAPPVSQRAALAEIEVEIARFKTCAAHYISDLERQHKEVYCNRDGRHRADVALIRANQPDIALIRPQVNDAEARIGPDLPDIPSYNFTGSVLGRIDLSLDLGSRRLHPGSVPHLHLIVPIMTQMHPEQGVLQMHLRH